MKTGLAGKAVLVTGGASGIGRASCLAFAGEGAKVLVADTDVKGGEETASMVRAAGGEAAFMSCDVSNGAEVERLVARAVETYGRLDCAHNNAGIAGPAARTAEYGEEAWNEVIGVNLKGVWLCMKHELLEMAGRRSGAIVNTASVPGFRGSRFASAYAAASHGIIGLTRTAALEYAADGIRINAVCPGMADTPMIRRRLAGDAKREAQVTAGIPIGRMASADEIAQAVVWLCSDAASYITGHILVADGGRSAE